MSLGETTLLIHRAIREWLLLYSGLAETQVLPARNFDQQRPNAPHIAIRVRAKQGRIVPADERRLNVDGSLTIRGERVATVQLTAVGACAVEALDDLEMSRARPDVEALLWASGVVIDSITEAIEENAQYEAAWEPRTFRELRISFIESRTFSAPEAEAMGAVLATTVEADTAITDFDDDLDLGIVAEARYP